MVVRRAPSSGNHFRAPAAGYADDPREPCRLADLVRRVAQTDHGAFTDLYGTLSAAVLTEIRRTLPERVDAGAVNCATFVEVWSLAGFHCETGTDVPAWIAGIANRRASERLRLTNLHCGQNGIDDRARTGRPPFWDDFLATDDRRVALTLDGLLDHRAGPEPGAATG
jgi:hypothetical protein